MRGHYSPDHWPCRFPPGKHTFRAEDSARFPGIERRSFPVPNRPEVYSPWQDSLSGFPPPAWHRLPCNSPVSDYSPFMVELFAAIGLADGPRSDHSRLRSVARAQAPHTGRVERTTRVRTPRVGFGAALGCSPPTLSMTALVKNIQGLSASPTPRGENSKSLSDRTRRLLDWETKPVGLLSRASVEPSERLTTYSALQQEPVAAG